MEQFDIAIIGTGPAGLSAALTATIRNKRIVLFGRKSLSEKVEKAHVVENYLGLPHTSGADMARAFQIHLDSLGITITDERVTAVYSMGDYFALQTSSNSMIGLLYWLSHNRTARCQRDGFFVFGWPRLRERRKASAWFNPSREVSSC